VIFFDADLAKEFEFRRKRRQGICYSQGCGCIVVAAYDDLVIKTDGVKSMKSTPTSHGGQPGREDLTTLERSRLAL